MSHALPFERKPLAIIISTLLSSLSFTAFADDVNNLDAIQVWGTKISSSTSLLSEDIETKQADHMSDLLRDQPGVDIGGSHPLNQSVAIRGVSELDLNISIDGVNQSNNVFHHVGNLLLNPDIIKAVDLQVGNNSIINGGLGGGIAFETKDAKDLLKEGSNFGARLFGGIASNDYHNYSGTVYSQANEFDFMAYYSVMDRDNFEDGGGVKQIGQEGKLQNYLFKTGWDINDSNRLVLSYDYYEDEGDYRLKSNLGVGYDSHVVYPISYSRETFSLTHELSLTNTEVHSTFYSNEMNYNPIMDGVDNEAITDNLGLKVLAETDFETGDIFHVARYGIEGIDQESDAYQNDQRRSGYNEKTTTYSLYLEDEMELVEGFFLTPGVRYDHHEMDTNSSDDTFTETSFALASKYLISDQWTVRASATELFKGPQVPGSFIQTPDDKTENLKAETGINYEVGASFEEQQFAGLDSFGFSVTLFQTQINDYIDDIETGKSGIQNKGDVEIQGVEVSMNGRLGNVSSRLTYTHTDSEYTDVNEDFVARNRTSAAVLGESLEDSAGDSISLNIGYAIPHMDLTANWTSMVTLDLDADNAEDLDKDGYSVHNISLQWIPANVEGLTVTAGIENMFDEHYFSHASYSDPDFGIDYESGRNFKLTAAYSL